MSVRPAKTQISLGIRPVWSESSLSAWRKLKFLGNQWAHSEDSDQTRRMPRLIWVFAGRTATLLVLSCRGSYWSLKIPWIKMQSQSLVEEKYKNTFLRMYTGLVFLDLRTFRAGQRLLPRDLTGNRIPAIILSLSRKPGPGFSKIRHLLFDSRFTSGRRKEYGLFFTFQRSS